MGREEDNEPVQGSPNSNRGGYKPDELVNNRGNVEILRRLFWRVQRWILQQFNLDLMGYKVYSKSNKKNKRGESEKGFSAVEFSMDKDEMELTWQEEKLGKYMNENSIAWFREFLFQASLMDLSLVGGSFNWGNNREDPTFVRLDRFLVSDDFLGLFPDVVQLLLPKSISDHNAMALESSKLNWGPKPFRLFNYIMEEERFKETVEKKISEVKSRKGLSIEQILRETKMKIRNWSNERRMQLQRLIDNKERLFSNQEIQLQQRNSFVSMNAYNAIATVEFEKLELNFNRLSDDQVVHLEENFSEGEVWEAIESSDSNKAPSSDGLDMGFFKKFWPVLKGDTHKFFEDFYDGKKLGKGVNHSFITLILKKQNPIGIEDYRPISLVGGLYKILSKFLSSTLRLCIGGLIGQSQFAFIPGRQIYDLIIFCKASKGQLANLKRVLVVFEMCTGLQLNLVNSRIFGINLQDQIIGEWAKSIGCKLSTLSIAGRTVLIKSVLNALPNYYMSLFKLPVVVRKKLKSIMANFLWGSSAEKKRFHWVNWNTICKNKELGELGISDLKLRNRALLGKWVGKGDSITFWHDSLISNYSLKSMFPRIFAPKEGVVADFGCMSNGKLTWDLQLRRNLMDSEFEHWMEMMVLLDNFQPLLKGGDCLAWKGSGDDVFSVQSCSRLVSSLSDSDNSWLEIVWRGLVTPKVEIFLWQIINQKLDVKTILMSREVKIIDSPYVCSVVWNQNRNQIVFEKGKFDKANLFFLVRYRVASWFLAKNKDVSIQVDNLVGDISLADFHKSPSNFRLSRLKWCPPPTGYFKMNVDGAVNFDWRRSGIGGVLKDADKNKLVSFSRALGPCSPILAEIFAIKVGLAMFFESVWRDKGILILESDSFLAVNWINSPEICSVHLVDLISEIQKTIVQSNIIIKHISRCINVEVDCLAKSGIG
ncbi:uncharacterized protein LOC120130004 [Hibiscus syriacus]|uniref:uncharacterized protein LOC120130004 n=1 Tax=Hibiscus syriacus TaxID=106335 RepID=UPI001922B3A7|nr:uncharacterized protein LOC120130004 [Hibiscus syriacus]